MCNSSKYNFLPKLLYPSAIQLLFRDQFNELKAFDLFYVLFPSPIRIVWDYYVMPGFTQ